MTKNKVIVIEIEVAGKAFGCRVLRKSSSPIKLGRYIMANQYVLTDSSLKRVLRCVSNRPLALYTVMHYRIVDAS